MANIHEFEYRGRRIQVTVNQSGATYVGMLDIEGVKLPPAQREVTSTSEDGAAASGKRKAENIIDAQTPPPQTP